MKITSVILAALILLLVGCSESDETEPEKGRIEQMTEKLGNDAARAIKDPLEKAKKAAALTEQHNKTVEEAGTSQ